jgi:uncharacterized protein (TIGR02266 family)
VTKNAAVKDNLKRIVQEHLGKSVSSLFLDKSLAIMDESADNKESFIIAAVRISKRITMFIDKDLAQTVYEKLMAAIEKADSPQGIERRYARIPFTKKVRVTHDGANHELDAENLSEGGMYIKTKKPFPPGSKVEIALPLEAGIRIQVTGVVLYTKDPFDDNLKLPPGVAVEFKKIRAEETAVLQSYIGRALTQDVLESQGEWADLLPEN